MANEDLTQLTKKLVEFKKRDEENNKNLLTYFNKTLYNYVEYGKALSETQLLCKELKIDFYKYILEQVNIKERTAQRYMQLAKNERLKNIDKDYFNNMKNPTFTKLLKIINFEDETFYKIINGDDESYNQEKKSQENKNNQKKDSTKDSNNKSDDNNSYDSNDSNTDTNDYNKNSSNNSDDKLPNSNSEDTTMDTKDSNSDTNDDNKGDEIANKYPSLFTDEEYENIVTATKELLIELIVEEREKYMMESKRDEAI